MQCVQDNGGVLSLEDLRENKSTLDTPIKTTYRDTDVMGDATQWTRHNSTNGIEYTEGV